MRKLFFFYSICLMSLHVTVLSFALSYLLHAPCLYCPTAVATCLSSSKWWISSEIIFRLFILDSFDDKCLGWKPISALPFATMPIISFILRTNSLQILSHFISDKLVWKVGRFSPLSCKSCITSGKVVTYLIYILQQVPLLIVSASLRNCIMPRLLMACIYIYIYIYIYIPLRKTKSGHFRTINLFSSWHEYWYESIIPNLRGLLQI